MTFVIPFKSQKRAKVIMMAILKCLEPPPSRHNNISIATSVTDVAI